MLINELLKNLVFFYDNNLIKGTNDKRKITMYENLLLK